MFNIPLKAFLILKLVTFDQEDTGEYTYLFETKIGTRSTHIAYTSKDLIGKGEGTYLKADVTGECSEVFGVNEEASDKMNAWVSYKAYICNANKIDVKE